MTRITSINRDALLCVLSYSKGYARETDTFYPDIECPDYSGNTVIRANVYVLKDGFRFSKANRAHKIFVGCPKCGKLIPFGRIAQHYKRDDH